MRDIARAGTVARPDTAEVRPFTAERGHQGRLAVKTYSPEWLNVRKHRRRLDRSLKDRSIAAAG
jgi:hypothetical protein